MNPALAFLKALEDGYTPTPQQHMQLAYALHAAMAPEPVMDRMTTSFEAVGDAVSRAIRQEDEAIANAKEFFRLRSEFAKFQQGESA
jgi:hypothetical protein